jgi:hypothetical protein
MIQTYRESDLGYIDPACPVNWGHSLSRGLVLWLMAAPNSGWRGGITFRDIVRGGHAPHDGTLTNGPKWVGGGRPGGSGAVALDGTNDYVSLPYTAFSSLSNMTLAMWVKPTTALSGADVYYWDAIQRLKLRTAFASYDGLSGVIQIGGTQTTINVASGVGGAVGKWTFLAMAYDGATFSLYADGKVVGTPASVTGNLDWTSFSDNLASWGSTTGGAAFFPGNVDSFVLYNRGLSTPQIQQLYSLSKRGNPGLVNRLIGTVYFLPPSGAATYTATAALAAGHATLSGSATFSPGTHTASAALSTGHPTLSGLATFSPGIHTATAAVAVGHATLSGSATFTAPIYTATAALNVSHQTLSGSATFVAPIYTGVASLTVSHHTLSGSATFVGPIYTATAALTVNHQTLSGTATFTAPIYTATAALTTGHATLIGSALFATVIYQGSASVSTGHATLTGVATFVVPTYHGTGTLTAQHATLSGNATFVPPVYTATASLATSHATISGIATFRGLYTGTAVLTVKSATIQGTAQFYISLSRATAALLVHQVTIVGLATYTPSTAVPPITEFEINFVYTRFAALNFKHIRELDLSM